MKCSKTHGKEEKIAAKQLRKYLKTDEEWVSLILTYMGMMSIMLDFLADTFGATRKLQELPERTRYAIAQAISHYRSLGIMMRGDVAPSEFELLYVPIRDDAWDNSDQINDRMALVVKDLYEQLKKEGRL